ncbi:hypothetical protein LguiA_024515 [Lonicera macranthoides]
MAPRKKNPSLPSPMPIGNCEVVVEAKNFSFESNQNSLQISLSRNTQIKISVVEDKSGQDCHVLQPSGSAESDDCYFVVVNPKDVDGHGKYLIQETLQMYMKELPAMSYAANTGKKSMFLERCVSNGKYCTLLLKSNSIEGPGEVISAITFQIVAADTQFAEVPLAAVSLIHQHKGIGCLMYKELRKRLQSVGIHTIFCWGDKESEGFWLKQGFVSIGEVDTKGRGRRLPIKANIRRALCFPGGSTLMVSHLNNDTLTNPAEPIKLPFLLKPLENSSPFVAQNQGLRDKSKEPDAYNDRLPLNGSRDLVPLESMDCSKMANDLGLTQIGSDVDVKNCSCSSLGAKKRVWASSCTSLKSKNVKGGHFVDCQLDSKDFILGSDTTNNCCLEKDAIDCRAVNITSVDCGVEEPLSGGKCYRIMLMNIADNAKKSGLTKIIEDLGGTVTSDGSVSTHIITGKVRKTLNFCTALCSGVWIISPNWLKESFRKGRFVDELPFILKDEDYEMKYRTELKDAVLRAKASPRALLKGRNICLADHVQPQLSTLSAIVKSAGGNVIRGVDKANEASKTIFVASEEDMEDALSAVKRGILTFSSEWLMNCIMRQELDLDAPQFAESL